MDFESEEFVDDHEDEINETEEESQQELYETYGEYSSMLIEGIEHNEWQMKYANENLEGYVKEVFLNKSLIDIPELKKRIVSLIERRKLTEEKLQQMDPDSAATWILEDEIYKQEQSLRSYLRQGISTVTSEDISELSDTYNHIIEDTLNPGWRDARLDVKQLEKLPYAERRNLIEKWYAEAKIDSRTYNALIMEYL